MANIPRPKLPAPTSTEKANFMALLAGLGDKSEEAKSTTGPATAAGVAPTACKTSEIPSIGPSDAIKGGPAASMASSPKIEMPKVPKNGAEKPEQAITKVVDQAQEKMKLSEVTKAEDKSPEVKPTDEKSEALEGTVGTMVSNASKMMATMPKKAATPDSSSGVAVPDGAVATPSSATTSPGPLHKLENSWTLWFDTAQQFHPNQRKQSSSWEANLVEVATFDTVEDFWVVKDAIKPPSKLDLRANYHLFRTGIKPMWEDRANKAGGKWTFVGGSLGGNRSPPNRLINDTLWEAVMLMCIGGGDTTAPDGAVCGAVVAPRQKGDKIAVWIADANDSDAVAAVEFDLMRVLKDIGSECHLGKFKPHYSKN